MHLFLDHPFKFSGNGSKIFQGNSNKADIKENLGVDGRSVQGMWHCGKNEVGDDADPVVLHDHADDSFRLLNKKALLKVDIPAA